jgi:hypothetical protein
MAARTAWSVAVILVGWSSRAFAQQEGEYLVGLDNCASGPRGAVWSSVRSKIRGIFEKDGNALVRTETQVLSDISAAVYKELKEAQALTQDGADECGLGRLSFQLLSFASADAEALLELFSSSEKLASPVLTSLLDVPWLAVAKSGWPIFGLLSEINHQKRHAGVSNKDEVDGLDKPIGQAFYQELLEAVIKGDGATIGQVTNLYLSMDNKDKNAYASLAALVAGAASSEAKDRMQLLDVTQKGLKQVVSNALELDVALGTRWPFWGLMHAAADVFSA